MEYNIPKNYNHKEIAQIEASKNIDQIAEMLIGVAFNENDLNYAFKICEKYAYNDSEELVCASLEALANLARRFKALPVEPMQKIIKQSQARLPSEAIEWGLEILSDDLKIFIPSLFDLLF